MKLVSYTGFQQISHIQTAK